MQAKSKEITDIILSKFKSWAEESHDTVQYAYDSGQLDYELYGVIAEQTKGTAWTAEHNKMSRALHKQSAAAWDKLFKEKYGVTSQKMVTELEKNELVELPENIREFLKDLGYHLCARVTPTGIRSGSVDLQYFKRSPKRMVMRGCGMQGVIYSIEALAKFQLDMDSVEAYFTTLGVKISKRPKPVKFTPSYYD